MEIAIVGGGWSGLACAIEATRLGHRVKLFESARHLGGRARVVPAVESNGLAYKLDNGQHILIGAYHETLNLMSAVGLHESDVLLRLPMALKYPDGAGLQFGTLPPPFDALAGIALASGWSWLDKLSLIRASVLWRLAGFTCEPTMSVAQLCAGIRPRVLQDMIFPLCISALNTPANRASAQVFLRVMKDALFGARGSSNLLLPRTDLSSLFPDAAERWLTQRGAEIRLGHRVRELHRGNDSCGWLVDGLPFDSVVLAMDSSNAASLIQSAQPRLGYQSDQMLSWLQAASQVNFEAITTVYAVASHTSLRRPMLALYSDETVNPAQFVFDRGQMGGPVGLLAFVVSASTTDKLECQRLVVDQAKRQLGLSVTPIQTIVEKRATFACTPGLKRPTLAVDNNLYACGDYVEGPYPATLEGAVRNGLLAARAAAMAHVAAK